MAARPSKRLSLEWLTAASEERKVRVAAYLAIHPALPPHVDVGKLGRQGQGADVADEWQPRWPRGEARRSPLPQELAEHQHEKQQEQSAQGRRRARLDSGRLHHRPGLDWEAVGGAEAGEHLPAPPHSHWPAAPTARPISMAIGSLSVVRSTGAGTEPEGPFPVCCQ